VRNKVITAARQVIQLRTRDEIDKLRRANAVVATVLARVAEEVKPGVATAHLDQIARSLCEEKGAWPAFLGYNGYPASLCVSLNDEVVHGIPSKHRKIKEGDIVSLDFGAVLEGYVGDSAVTVMVGMTTEKAQELVKATREALYFGIRAALPGGRLYDIGHAIQSHVESHGFNVVRDFVGHGIGARLHEPPQIPNFGKKGTGIRLKPGMVFAIEPMVNAGDWQVNVKEDGWTAVTADGSLSAHFEHSIALDENGPVILSEF
jgi:methionyl aminopeptidase